MDIFRNSRVVKLRGYHETYLLAVDDQKSIAQGGDISSNNNAQWTVELVPGSDSVIRLKSCYGKYLTATEEPFLRGITGAKKVHQTLPRNLDASVDWVPTGQGNDQSVVKLRNSLHDTFLRASNRVPPRRNSVSHRNPLRTSAKNYKWRVEIVSTTEQSSSSNPQRAGAARASGLQGARQTLAVANLGVDMANLGVDTADLAVNAALLGMGINNQGNQEDEDEEEAEEEDEEDDE